MTMRHLLIALVIGSASIASAQPRVATTEHEPAPHSLVIHTPPLSAPVGAPIELAAMIDAPFAETLGVAWRPVGTNAWAEVPFERSSAGGWYATLPPATPPGVEYFIHGKDAAGLEVEHFASAREPQIVRVDPEEIDRLEELDLKRLGYTRDAFSVDVAGHDFGNRYGFDDRWIRTEAAYTHRFLRWIHQISFGFGTIDGRTPNYEENPSADTTSVLRQLRYGFGEVRFRPYRSLFVDARASLGVSQDGFTAGAGGRVWFGRPWRSNVSVGGEYLGDLGGTATVRLQWDTAAPFLMGASVVKTNLPGVVVDHAGLYIAYDIVYRIGRLSLKGQLSYGARDGSSHVGGGLGTAIDF
jgi:hypothetical protein